MMRSIYPVLNATFQNWLEMSYFLIPNQAANTFCAISGAEELCFLRASDHARMGIFRHSNQEVVIEFTRQRKSAFRSELVDIRVNELLVLHK